jgi:hypothetical protein
MNFKKVIMTLLICLAICGMSMSCASATWVAHCGKYFGTGDYWATTGHGDYEDNSNAWDQSDEWWWSVNAEDITDMCRDLADMGYCHCVYYDGKKKVVYVFDNKSMAPGEYYEKYITYDNGPNFRVRISVNNGRTSWF